MTSDHSSNGNKYLYIAQEFSLPLLLGVVVAIVFANAAPDLYKRIVDKTYSFVLADDHKDEHGEDHGDEKHSDKKNNKEDAKQQGSTDVDSKETSDHDSDEAHSDKEHRDKEHSNEAHGDHGHDWKHYLTLHFHR